MSKTMKLLGFILIAAYLSGIDALSDSALLTNSHAATNVAQKAFIPKFAFYKHQKLIKTCYGVHLRRKRLQPGGQHWVMPAECFDNTKYDMVWIYGYEKGVARTPIDSVPYRAHPHYNSSTKSHNIAVVSFNSHQDPVKGYSHIELPSDPEDFDISSLQLYKLNTSSTNSTELQEEISLYSVKTKPISSFWCTLLYPYSPIKENHICASGWFRKGLSEDELGTPVTTKNGKTYTLVGLATIGRPWTHYISFPVEFLKIEPYLDWINGILDDEFTLN